MEGWGCYSFQWGGCDGNMNNFWTKEDCMRKCNIEEGGAKGKKLCIWFYIIFNSASFSSIMFVCLCMCVWGGVCPNNSPEAF